MEASWNPFFNVKLGIKTDQDQLLLSQQTPQSKRITRLWTRNSTVAKLKLETKENNKGGIVAPVVHTFFLSFLLIIEECLV